MSTLVNNSTEKKLPRKQTVQRLILSLMAIFSLSTLTACSDNDSLEPTTPEVNVTRMTTLISSYPTIRARSSEDTEGSKYVYERAADGDLLNVDFLDAVSGANLSVENTPTIQNVVDINDLYVALTFEKISITFNGTNYNSALTLIQNKKTGYLYPLISNNQPIVLSIKPDDQMWTNESRSSNVADNENLYFHYGDTNNLHIAKFNNDHFVITEVFSDNLREYWVLDNGEIISKAFSGQAIEWYSPLTETTITHANTNNYQPFVHDGALYAIDESKQMFRFVKTGLVILTILTTWDTGDYINVNQSVKRNGYEMQSNCSIYYFDQSDTLNPVITKIAASRTSAYSKSVAAEDSLFCIYSEDQSDTTFIRFNTSSSISTEMTTATGDSNDALARLSVINDEQLMFHQTTDISPFTETYVDVLNATEVVINNTTGLVNIIKMETTPQ